MGLLILLLGIIIGFLAGGIISFFLLQRKIRWENSPAKKVENFISEFNRFYRGTKRKSNP